MLYVAIDQHAKQITVAVRNDQGEDVLKRQVSTRPEKIKEFFDQVVAMDTQFMAILESCGFNDWLIEELRERNCREIVLIHPERPSKKKTDRRDAHKLCDLLWLNRDRLAEGKSVRGLRRIYIATKQEQEDRQITTLRQGLGRRRTRVLNKIQRILHRYNLMWQYPTKSFQTLAGRAWLQKLSLPEMDRFERDLLLEEWAAIEEQIKQVDAKIVVRASRREPGQLFTPTQILMTAPGVSYFSGLGLASRIGPIERFPRSRSLANYFGLTPSSRNSGEAKDRLGSITKEGSKLARFLLGQLVLHFLKQDPKNEAVVSPDQAATRIKDCPFGHDAADHHDLLAHADVSGTLRDRGTTAPFATTIGRRNSCGLIAAEES
jgi:transposase